MNFFKYATQYDQSAHFSMSCGLGLKEGSAISCATLRQQGDDQLGLQIQKEYEWAIAHRPYYSVYPVAVQALQKIKLDVPCNLVRLPLPTISIQFSEKEKFEICGHTVKAALVADKITVVDDISFRGFGAWLLADEVHDGIPVYWWVNAALRDEYSVEQELNALPSMLNEVEIEVFDAVIRVVVGICLMTGDDSLISPDVLSDDRIKYEDTGDEKYVAKAHRRGKVGWLVGRHVEVDPHYRRPHFGLRWTGHGRQTPRIVPIKGCIVHRRKLLDVPSGYEDPKE